MNQQPDSVPASPAPDIPPAAPVPVMPSAAPDMPVPASAGTVAASATPAPVIPSAFTPPGMTPGAPSAFTPPGVTPGAPSAFTPPGTTPAPTDPTPDYRALYESLRRENEILRQNAETASRSPVQAVSGGGAVTVVNDDFIRGFDSDTW